MNFDIGMRISPNIRELGYEKMAEWAASVGIDVIDLPDLNEEIKAALDQAGVKPGSIDGKYLLGPSPFLGSDEGKISEALKELDESFARFSANGASVIFMCLMPPNNSQTRKESFAHFENSFYKVTELAEKHNVYLAMEGYPGSAPAYPTLGCTPETMRAMFKAAPSKHFGLNYDPSHLVRLGIDHLRVLEEFSDRIVYCHGKDTELLPEEQYLHGHLPATFGSSYDFSEGSWRYTIPGEGIIQWDRIAVRLEKAGYKRAVSIELEDHRYWGTLENEQQGIVKARNHLARYLK
ncbi:sugar phosphate isomerase/epimerase family protein [Aureibacillus halotolerans]|uniref:Sugar phosphate isomerase/epimerase n=1 Tax=Aureibacillus halotolerans TaxID=1508390 RepID=A0A4R6UGA0_9BACI|nr:sugar phosphate isomerase/epimerase [Aureibacillus halotolerans]TDQ42164.1 sugar phosphate isomerase/epimerase [Aureibacillus halotolerans]